MIKTTPESVTVLPSSSVVVQVVVYSVNSGGEELVGSGSELTGGAEPESVPD